MALSNDEILDAIANMTVQQAADLVKAMEEKYGITVYDTINTVVWDCLDMAGLDPALVQNWGRLFEK